MKRILCLTAISVAAVAALVGCASPSTRTMVNVSKMLDANGAPTDAKKPLRTEADRKREHEIDTRVWAGLRNAKTNGQAGLPASLAGSRLVQKLTAANWNATPEARSPGETKDVTVKTVKFRPRDFQLFIDETIPRLSVSAWGGDANVSAMAGSGAGEKLLQQYLVVYFQGNFVDRAGRAIAKPAFKDSAISNDTITGFATVILEALCDLLYDVPVLYEKKGDSMRWLTPTGKEPTYARLAKQDDGGYDPAKVRDIVAEKDITMTELDAIQFLASIASEESKAGSGLIFRFLGGGEASLVLGAHLAVGNNETLAKLVDTFFEVVLYRWTEAKAYAYFKKYDENDYGAGLQRLMELLKKIHELYKDGK